MFTEPITFFKKIKEIIEKEMSKLKSIDVYQITGFNADTYTVNIKHPLQIKQYNNIPISGAGLGDFRGIMSHPNVGDMCTVGFLGKGQNPSPIVLGTLFNSFATNKDNIPQIKEKELLIRNDTLGCNILMNSDIIIKVPDSTGNLDNGPRLKMKGTGEFILINKGGFGIRCDASGKVTIAGTTVDFTTTPMPFS